MCYWMLSSCSIRKCYSTDGYFKNALTIISPKIKSETNNAGWKLMLMFKRVIFSFRPIFLGCISISYDLWVGSLAMQKPCQGHWPGHCPVVGERRCTGCARGSKILSETWRYRKEKMLYLWKGRWNLHITLLKMKSIFPPPPFLRFQTLIFQGVPDVSRWVVGRNGSPSSDFFSKPAFRVFISSKAA